MAASAPEGSPLWQKAVYGQAVCAEQAVPKPDVKEAGQLYTLLMAKSPESPFTPRTMMNMGRIYKAQLTG